MKPDPRLVEVEVGDGTWIPLFAECECQAQVRRIMQREVLSLGPGHQSRPMVTGVTYECAACGAPLKEDPDGA